MTDAGHDVVIIGGGIVGMATALALTEGSGVRVVVLEAEDRLAAHQTGHNSGVIHSGLYYKPGSLKARECVLGREALYRFCAEEGIAHERCGKIVVATEPEEIPMLDELERRGKDNGLLGVRRLEKEEIAEYEPHAAGLGALHVPETGIVDYSVVTEAYARRVRERGGEVRVGARAVGVRTRGGEVVVETEGGAVHARYLVNCAGLQSDRVAKMSGVDPGVRITGFRGEYYTLVPERRHLVRNLIYPVPDPRFPFLGVHFTRMIGGGIEAGPNAVLALRREGYRRTDFSSRDVWSLATFGGTWRMAARYYRTGFAEVYRSFSKRAFVKTLQRLVPELGPDDVEPGGSGVRAQALEPDGGLVDDFRIVNGERMIHVLNAPSPAATASLRIGQTVARMARERFDLGGRTAAESSTALAGE